MGAVVCLGRVLLCRLTLLTHPARQNLGQLLGYQVRLEAALQLSSSNKRCPIIRVGGRVSLQDCGKMKSEK